VKAKDMFGTTAGPTWSFTIASVNAPTNLSVASYGSNSVSLSWTDNSNNESQFLIERRNGASGSFFQVGTANANMPTFTDATGLPNSAYYYQVRAWDGASAYSGYSNQVLVTTLASTPTGLSASDGTFANHVALSWSAATGATAYQIYRNTVNDPNTATSLFAPTATSFDDSTASANTTYYYWVASYNSANAVGPKSTVNTGFADTISPTVSSDSVQQEMGPPYVAFTFSENVEGSVSGDSLQLTNLDDAVGATPIVASYQYLSGSNTAQFLLNPALPDGNFKATISGVTDIAGNALDGSNVQAFYFLNGDATGDRTVNALDFNTLAGHFGSSGAGFSGGDFDFDGTVTTADFDAIALHWGKVVPVPSGGLPLAGKVAPANLFGATPVVQKDPGFTDFSSDVLSVS
jgi:hypothetical protein